MALGTTDEESAEAFQTIWRECLTGVYPMEVQVIKETCVDKFEQFIAWLNKSPLEKGNIALQSQSIKLMQLLKGRPNYRAIVEQEEPSQLNMIDDEETLLAYDDGEARHLKTVQNQIETFEYCLKTAPEVAGLMMRAVLQGSDSTVQNLIT